MDAVLNNPFRVLGLSTTASDREITKRISDLLLYAEMGKKVRYETDFEFLGEVDRSLDNIKEAAKRLENNDLKLFYSLMWFEIKDEVDKSAFKFFEKNEYDQAINLLEEDVFANSPIVYNPLGRLWGGKQIDVITWGNMTTSKIKDTPHIKHIKYEINLENTPPKGLALVSLSKRFRVSTFQSELIQIEETKFDIPVIDKYQICLTFLPIQLYTKKIVLTISTTSEQNIEFDFVIDLENVLTITKKNYTKNDNTSVIYSSKIEIDYLNNNNLSINKIDNIIEIKFNNKKLYSIDNNNSFSSFYISILGSVFINDLTLFELANRKLYCDIELNENTTSRVKNLAIMKLIGNNKDFRPKSTLDFFQLYGKFYKQNYFKKYSKGIISDSYIIDESRMTDLFVDEFYNHFKSGNIIDNKHPELYFYAVFYEFSNEAYSKAKNKLMSMRLYEFKKFIKDISNQRINKLSQSSILSAKLFQSATDFFIWYAEFDSWSDTKLRNSVGTELLECGISHYNNSNRNLQTAKEAIQIIKLASEFSRSIILRDRIENNLNIITKTHDLDQIIFDFKKMDINNYLYSISNKDSKGKTNPILPKNELKSIISDNSSTESEIIVKENEIIKKSILKSKTIKIIGIIIFIASLISFYYLIVD